MTNTQPAAPGPALTAQAPAPSFKVTAASKDVKCSGRIRYWWYRMLWDGTAWRYFAESRLPLDNYRAAQRCASVEGWVSAGDVVLQHDFRGPVTEVYLVEGPDSLRPVPWFIKGGRLIIQLPDGQLDTPCPRK